MKPQEIRRERVTANLVLTTQQVQLWNLHFAFQLGGCKGRNVLGALMANQKLREIQVLGLLLPVVVKALRWRKSGVSRP